MHVLTPESLSEDCKEAKLENGFYLDCHDTAKTSYQLCSKNNQVCKCYYVGAVATKCLKFCEFYHGPTLQMLNSLCGGMNLFQMSLDPKYLSSIGDESEAMDKDDIRKDHERSMNQEDQTNLLGGKFKSINHGDPLEQVNDNDETGPGEYTKESHLFGKPWPYEIEWERDSLVLELGYNEDDEYVFTAASVPTNSRILAKGTSTLTPKHATSHSDRTSESSLSSVGTILGNGGGNLFPFGQPSPPPPLLLPPHLQENQVKLPVSFPRLTTVTNAQTTKSIGGKKTISTKKNFRESTSTTTVSTKTLSTKSVFRKSPSTKTTSKSKVLKPISAKSISTVYTSVQSTLTKSVLKKLTSSSKYILTKTITEVVKTNSNTVSGGDYNSSNLADFTNFDNKHSKQWESTDKQTNMSLSSLVSSFTSHLVSLSSSSSRSIPTSPLTATSTLTSALKNHRDDKPKNQDQKTMPSLEEIIRQKENGKELIETGTERERLIMPPIPHLEKASLQEKQLLHDFKTDEHVVNDDHGNEHGHLGAEANDALGDHIMSRNSILFMFEMLIIMRIVHWIISYMWCSKISRFYISTQQIATGDEYFGGRIISDEYFGGRIISDEYFGGRIISDEYFGGRIISNEYFGGRIIFG
ncbi:unnamed protein product [Ambrosiozyma monospora]|uniref:Unnamed protein product n=1 Tax=Ambrosiozyma monospora TaxID=43982 RepID=A0A9W6YRM3_AMBMO|nr:unnamed protein product [Ambrosiozyma monospora]